MLTPCCIHLERVCKRQFRIQLEVIDLISNINKNKDLRLKLTQRIGEALTPIRNIIKLFVPKSP